MSSPNNLYEKTQKAKNSLKFLLKSSKGNIKSLIQKKSNDLVQIPTRQIISLSQICSNLNNYGPSINFYIEAASSRESSPSLSPNETNIKQPSNLSINDVLNLLFETYQLEFSDDFQRLSQVLCTLDNEKIGLIVTNIKIKTDLDAIKLLIMNSAYHPELTFIKIMYFRSKPAVIIKMKRISDIFFVLNFLNTNKTIKQLLGTDLKVLWFRTCFDTKHPYNEFPRIIFRNLPSNFSAPLIKSFIQDNYPEIEIKYIEDPMYFKGQVSCIVLVENCVQAENLVKKMNNFMVQERYVVKVKQILLDF